MKLSEKAKTWILLHSTVDLVNIAACKEMLDDLELQVELQSFVYYTISRVTLEMFDETKLTKRI